MHGMHARLPKNFVLEERLERYARAIELKPTHYAGCWTDACRQLCGADTVTFDHLHVDLGCGKGAYVVQAAQVHPHTLYVAIDAEPICVAYTAQHAMEAALTNVVVVPAVGSSVADIFAPEEVSSISLNFPTPFPRKKEAFKRLTILERLNDYRQVLAPEGTLCFKTDSYPLWRFTLEQLELAAFDVLWQAEDARSETDTQAADKADMARYLADEPLTEYEQRLTAQGATVYALLATPSDRQPATTQTSSLSLVDYLPTDLEALDYVPHGMQGTVTNLRNRSRHAQMRARRRRS